MLADQFAAKVPAREFNPAEELWGYLIQHKRDAWAAVDDVEEFTETTRWDRKEKELNEAEAKREAAEEQKARRRLSKLRTQRRPSARKWRTLRRQTGRRRSPGLS